jgi:hypothetical protein
MQLKAKERPRNRKKRKKESKEQQLSQLLCQFLDHRQLQRKSILFKEK